jgi:biofilm PGA synthesis N-glycosyltransferase PgaC
MPPGMGRMKYLFWISLIFIAYAYVGYPLVLYLLSKLAPRKVDKKRLVPEPLVTVVVAARNEAETIGKKIENLLGQHYPPDRLEIVIVSDGSTDATNEIAGRYAAAEAVTIRGGTGTFPRLRLLTSQENRGKPHALGRGVSAAHGEYIVFADARQDFDPDAVRELIENFNDPKVGSVSGELVFRDDSDTSVKAEMGLYWTIEKWIRKMEGRVHSIAGATGAIYAIRKELFEEIPEETILDDVLVPMRIVSRGYRNVFEDRAIAFDVFSKDLAGEKRRKVRTLFGNYQLLRLMPELASVSGNPIFIQFISHKIFRLLVPFFFIALFVSSLLAHGFIYQLTFWGIVAAVLMSIFSGPLSRIPCLNKLCAFSRTFFSLNYFALLAFFYFLRPGKTKVW